MHNQRLDWLAWLLGGLTAFSLANAAYLATALAGFGSFALICIRVHDRWKYGPTKRGWDQ
jgi:hypothetical protein